MTHGARSSTTAPKKPLSQVPAGEGARPLRRRPRGAATPPLPQQRALDGDRWGIFARRTGEQTALGGTSGERDRG